MPKVKETICDFDNLYISMNKCRRGVLWKDSVAGWVKNGIRNCRKLENDLTFEAYKIDKYIIFNVYEPKLRVIVSTRFKDRVFQRSLCDNYLTYEISKHFIYDNGACLKGKGTDFARDRLHCHLQRYYRHYGNEGYVLKIDLHDFFGSTKHSLAKDTVRDKCEDDWAFSKVCDIIDSFNQGKSPEIGMGLGSQVTQLIQLAILDDLDHYIKEVLKIKYYVRYMDDFVLVHPDKEYLKYCYQKIEEYIISLGLELNKKKTQLFPLSQPIKFLGFNYKILKSGKVTKIITHDKVKREKRRLRKQVERVKNGEIDRASVDDGFASWIAHASGAPSKAKAGKPFIGRADNYFVIENMKKYYNSLWSESEL